MIKTTHHKTRTFRKAGLCPLLYGLGIAVGLLSQAQGTITTEKILQQQQQGALPAPVTSGPTLTAFNAVVTKVNTLSPGSVRALAADASNAKEVLDDIKATLDRIGISRAHVGQIYTRFFNQDRRSPAARLAAVPGGRPLAGLKAYYDLVHNNLGDIPANFYQNVGTAGNLHNEATGIPFADMVGRLKAAALAIRVGGHRTALEMNTDAGAGVAVNLMHP